MTTDESNLCLVAFNSQCEALGTSELVDLSECQYWLFELGYKAALEKLSSTITPLQDKHRLAA